MLPAVELLYLVRDVIEKAPTPVLLVVVPIGIIALATVATAIASWAEGLSTGEGH